MRACANPVDRPAAGLNPNEVVTEIVQVLLDSRLSRFTDGHNTDHSRNPDGDPENRQDASHLVSEQRHQCRSKESCVVHKSDASLGDATVPR